MPEEGQNGELDDSKIKKVDQELKEGEFVATISDD